MSSDARAGLRKTLAIMGLATLATSTASADPIYTITDLGNLQPTAINQAGQVGGSLAVPGTSGSTTHGAIAADGTLRDFPGLPGLDTSTLTAINSRGQAVLNRTDPGGEAKLVDGSGETALGDLGGTVRGHAGYTQGNAINNLGEVVGTSTAGTNGDQHAFLSTTGPLPGSSQRGQRQMIDLGTFGGKNSSANGINDSGQVVGQADTSSGASHAFTADRSGTKIDLGTLGGKNSAATAINASGQVVGYSNVAPAPASSPASSSLSSPVAAASSSSLASPFSSSSPSSSTPLTPATSPNSSASPLTSATSPNASSSPSSSASPPSSSSSSPPSTSASTSPSSSSSLLPSVSSPSASSPLSPVASPSASSFSSSTDPSTGTDTTHAFVLSDGRMRDLGTTGGYQDSLATAINTLGQIVGTLTNTVPFRTPSGILASPASGHAFLASASSSTMQDLNQLLPPSSGWELTSASGINDQGAIVGEGIHNGTVHGFLLTPSSELADPVPEPTTLGLLVVLAAAAGVRSCILRLPLPTVLTRSPVGTRTNQEEGASRG